MTIAELLLVPYEEIDYSALDAATLRELATQRDEPFIATSALGELAQRKGPEALAAATTILSRDVWDKYLTAFALTIAYSRNPEDTIATMSRLIESTDEPEIIGAILENLMLDVDRFKTQHAALVHTAVARVKSLPSEKRAELEDADQFLKAFGS